MLVYLTVILVLVLGVWIFDVKKQSENKGFFLLICFFLMVMMSSFRYRVGGDSLAYEYYYEGMPDLSNYIEYLDINPLSYQPLWLLLIAFCKSISTEFYFFQIVHALLFNIALFIFIRKHTKHVFSVLLLLFLSLMYIYYNFEIQRESLAIAVFLFNIENLEKKRWLRYFILVTISFLFHISAFFLFFLPFLINLELTKRKLYILLLFAVVIFFLREFIFSLITPFLILEAMRDKAEVYSEMSFSLVGFLAFFFVRVVLLLPFLLYRIASKTKTFKWLDFTFLFLSIMAQFFVGFERLLNYLYIIYFILFINFLYDKYEFQYSSILKKSIVFISFLHIFFILDYKLMITNSAGEHYYSLFYPYESIFLPADHNEREGFYYNNF